MEPKKKPGRSERRRRWRAGEPLTSRDRMMLDVLIRRAEQLGYTPTQAETPNAAALKQRFGNWNKVAQAAGLPSVSEREQSLRRQAAIDWRQTMTRYIGL